MKIGFLGFGETGSAFATSLAGQGPEFCAWDIVLAYPGAAAPMRKAMARQGVNCVSGPEGLADADWIFSAVTTGQCHVAAQALVPHLRAGQVVIDVNPVSPECKRACAAEIMAAGGKYLDMALLAPVQAGGHRTKCLIAGPQATGLLGDLRRLEFDVGVAGAGVGAASAIRMVRSLFVKGLEAITVETLLAAEAIGCKEEILALLSESYSGLGWPAVAADQFDKVMSRGQRRAAEMRECASTLDALGLTGDLARQIAEVQAATALDGVPHPDRADPGAGMGAVLAARLARR